MNGPAAPGGRSTVESAAVSTDSTQWTVIQRAAEGSTGAREEFVLRYSSVIRAYLKARWRAHSMLESVDDAVQHVFLACFQEDGPLGRADRERGEFRGYLYGIVRNVARTFERRRARRFERRPQEAVDLAQVPANDPSLSHVFDRAWASAVLQEASRLQRLRAEEAGPQAVRRHDLLGLRYGEGLPIRRIASRWGVEAAVLHRELPKAREEFKRALLDVVRDVNGRDGAAVTREASRLLQFFS